MTHYDIINAASVVPTDKGTPNQVVVSNQEIGCEKRLRLKIQQTKHIGVSINVVFFWPQMFGYSTRVFCLKEAPGKTTSPQHPALETRAAVATPATSMAPMPWVLGARGGSAWCEWQGPKDQCLRNRCRIPVGYGWDMSSGDIYIYLIYIYN